MKRTPFTILGLFLAIFTVLTFMNSCEVEHFYNTEITVVDASGQLKPGFKVRTEVSVEDIVSPTISQSDTTNEMGKVFFEFDNVAILKVIAEYEVLSGNDYYGEALLVLEEDKTVPITVVVYD